MPLLLAKRDRLLSHCMSLLVSRNSNRYLAANETSLKRMFHCTTLPKACHQRSEPSLKLPLRQPMLRRTMKRKEETHVL